MQTLPLNTAATKVLVKACKWADRRNDIAVTPAKGQRRAQGRYEISGDELAEAVEQYRKAGGQP